MSKLYTVAIPVQIFLAGDREVVDLQTTLNVNVWVENAQAAVDQLAENLRKLECHLNPGPPDSR